MKVKPAVLVALLAVLAGVALVQRAQSPDPLSPAALGSLLDGPLDPGPGASATDATWLVLLEHFAEPTEAGLTLRLGRVLADPTAARISAECAGELLELETEGPQGRIPLWRAILAGPSTEHGRERTLKVYGCLHSALPDAGPVIEDSYYARLALVRALREHAARDPEPLVLLGEHAPVRGGVNFEVLLQDEIQSVVVTFDGHPAAPLRVERPLRAQAPNDSHARASLVAALRERAATAGLGALTIEGAESSAAGGVDVHIETLDGRQSLVARRGGTRFATHRRLDAGAAREQ